MPEAGAVHIRPTRESDRSWMREEMRKWWGSETVVVRGEKLYPAELGGYIAEKDEEKIGLIILRIDENCCEILSLTTAGDPPGIGKKLFTTALTALRKKNISRLSVVTTNDNINALRFYQQLGFVISDWRMNAVEFSRKLKKEIPQIGNYNIPIRDEIELEMTI